VQVGHHGAQNHRTTSWPSSEPKLICPPLTVETMSDDSAGASSTVGAGEIASGSDEVATEVSAETPPQPAATSTHKPSKPSALRRRFEGWGIMKKSIEPVTSASPSQLVNDFETSLAPPRASGRVTRPRRTQPQRRRRWPHYDRPLYLADTRRQWRAARPLFRHRLR